MQRREFLNGMFGAVAALGTGGRTLRRLEQVAVFDVRRFGAAGDGHADDTAAFETALARAGLVGGTVVVPTGRYLTTRLLHIPSGTTLRGQGAQSLIERRNDGDRIAVATIGTQAVTIADIAIDGEMSHGLLIEHARNIQVDRCRIGGATIERYSYSSGVLVVDSSNISVRQCRLAGNGGDGALQGADIQVEGSGGRSSHVQIVGNDCASTDVAVNIRCYDLASSTIADNTVQGARRKQFHNHGYGILIYQTVHNPGSCFGNAVLRNRVRRTDGSGIYLQQSHHSTVADNDIDDVARTQDDRSLPVGAVALNVSNYTRVYRNTISRSGRTGISASSNQEGSGHVEIEDNVLSHTRGDGIQLRGLLTDVSVQRNQLTDVHGGIASFNDDAQHAVVIVGNVVMDCQGQPAIHIRNARASLVRGNSMRRCSNPPIDLTFADSASIAEKNLLIDALGQSKPVEGGVRRKR